MDRDLDRSMRKSIREDNVNQIQELLTANPGLLNERCLVGSWLNYASDVDSLQSVVFFVKEGLDVNDKGKEDLYLPILNAIRNKNISMLRFLCENGAEFELNSMKLNPLMFTITHGNLEIAQYLVSTGMDLTIKCEDQFGYLTDVVDYSKRFNTEIYEYLKEISGKEGDDFPTPLTFELKYDRNEAHVIDPKILTEKFEAAIKDIIALFLKKYPDKEIRAMSFWLHLNSDSKEWRYLVEPVMQTEEGLQEIIDKYQKLDNYDIRMHQYIPVEFNGITLKACETWTEGIKDLQKYLYRNCLNVRDNDIEDALYMKQKEIALEQNKMIDQIFAQTVASLRKQRLFVDGTDHEFYVFPFTTEDDKKENYLPNALIMNEGLEMDDYVEYMHVFL
ncbi:MAG: ankyrin repeat domain-containing protein [Clostridia bacterium]|nr:ankyrin repeat domain-containing protein [Clostridia bacterium]